MQCRQKTPPELQCVSHLETVYFLQLMLQGAPKPQKIAAKITKKTRFENPPFVLPPIKLCGKKFNTGA